MSNENSAEFPLPLEESENYTYISPVTFEMMFPNEVPSPDDIVREHPSELLRERSPEEIAQLRNHPFFAEAD